MESEFNNRMQISKELVTIAGSARDQFYYLGSIIHNKGAIDEDVTHWIKVGLLE